MLTEHSAGAIIYRKEQGVLLFLLLHYEEGHWGAPKGHIEKGETLEQTAIREIQEETGLTDVTFIPGFKQDDIYFYRREGQLSRKTVSFLLAETHHREIKISFEHVGFTWLPFSEAFAKVTFKSEKKVWQAAYAFLTKAGLN